ncbi:twin-arginine translocation signal domain-containing protein [Cyclobacterium roseum]|uniref:twin-arginine translocation signal domain-containing protein n=1 Tax=Cyclobacterium roseum TaxID=2666137 RepID=UPI001F3C0BDD|nr:twin-arginine translocation signal domain-containing protein [Cyclobacterium roseum]
MMNRRNFIRSSAACSALLATGPAWMGKTANKTPVRITEGPSGHWFGYYDKWQVDPSGRYALGCRVGFEGRSPLGTDKLEIGLIDLENGNRWKKIGETHAWSWQQSCMLQWIPGSAHELIWNDRQNDSYVSRIYHIQTGQTRTLPEPVYTLAPNGSFGIGTAFNRIQNLRPGYGYAGIPDPYQSIKAPDEIGLYTLDLKTGRTTSLLSLADLAAIPHLGAHVSDNWHWFNHLLVSPDSERLLFLHRWRPEILDNQIMARTGFVTRMITVNTRGEDLFVADPSGNSSHFVWRDPNHIFVWTRPVGKQAGFWLIKDKTEEMELIGEEAMDRNGHNTYVPHTNEEWVLNDTYPDKERMITLYLYHIPSNKKVILGKFHSPERFVGEWRCDLHPRCDQQGRRVFFDSTHEGSRQMYYLNISDIVGT